jgi:hypothetical protein
MTKTTVELTAEDAELFIKFRKHQTLFECLEQADALTTKGGSVEIHFDNLGVVRLIDVHRHYRTFT